MKTIQNISKECCDFEWIVIKNNKSIFGANTKEECDEYINNYKE